jgi:hypothetical protein
MPVNTSIPYFTTSPCLGRKQGLAKPYCTILTSELHAQIQQAQEDCRLLQQRHARYRALVRDLAAEVRELATLSLQAAQELQIVRNHWAYALIEPDITPKLYVKHD